MSRISNTNYTIHVAGNRNEQEASQRAARADKSKAAEERKTVFAGNVQTGEQTIIGKLQQAREKAWKIVSDAWKNEQQTDDTVSEIEQHKAEMLAELDEANEQLSKNAAAQEDLRQLYEVDVDSEEYKNVQLLKKEQDFSNGVSTEMPTLEEQEQLAEIKKQPLTEYQEKVLELNEHAAKFKKDIRDAKAWLNADTQNIQTIHLERLKSNPIGEAKQEADELLETASKEAVYEMIAEGKENIDEKIEEVKEQAEENAQKQEEKQEIREELEINQAIREAYAEGTAEAVREAEAKVRRKDAPEMDTTEMLKMSGADAGSGQAAQNLAELKATMKVLEADLKGIKVDEEI